MRTLIVSNRLTVDPEVLETEIVSWDDRPSVEGFPLVVLDLHFGESSADGFVKIDTPSHRFYELGAEVSRCLKAGGVVISCLGPIANTNRDLGGDGYRENAVSRKRARLESEQLPDARFESSYDWLDQGLLQKLQLGHRYVRPSEGLQWLLPNERFSRIKATLQKYVESFSNLDNYSGRASITYTMDESRRWDSNQHVIQTDVRILATAYHTNIPVAMSFDYNYFHGQLVFIPPLVIPEDSHLARLLAQDLKAFGEWINTTAHSSEEERPEWADAYLAPPAVAMVETITKLEQRIATLRGEIENYSAMLPLLFGGGTALEDAVDRLFQYGDSTLTVERTQPGAHLDMFIRDSEGRSLAIEVTGVNGPLRHSDRHWADFLQYMPEHHANNEAGRVERIVLVVNTLRQTSPGARDTTTDMTGPVRRTATDNGICVVRSTDLYSLWLKILEGSPTQQLFDRLFNTEGVFALSD